MPSELTVRAVSKEGMQIEASCGPHTVQMDYSRDPGADLSGFTPLQLLLASLAGCSGNTLVALLRRDRQPASRVEVHARATRRDEHPTVLTEISLEFIVRGSQIDAAAVERAMKQSEKLVCPVWAMLKGSTPIRASWRIAGERGMDP